MIYHEPTVEEYNDITSKGKVLVDFWATWCGPCRSQAPIVEKLEAESEVDLIKIDVDKADELPAKFGVTSIPTLLLYSDGKLIKQFVGLTNLETLKTAFDL